MITTQYVNLDMTPSGVLPVLYCSQYDVGRPLGMVVYNRGEAVDLDTYTCTIEATRTDGTAITTAVTTDGNIGAFATTATMTNKQDKYPAKMVIVDSNGNRIASLAFVMCVTPATMDENAESVEEDRPLYQQYTGTVQTLIAEVKTDLASETGRAKQAENALQTAITAEVTARANAINTEASARQAADTALQSAIDDEASTRSGNVASLQSQINQYVTPSTQQPDEVVNARVGADGTPYTTLGDAIRGQVTDTNDTLNGISTELCDLVQMSVLTTATGWRLNQTNGKCAENADYKLVKYSVEPGTMVKVISDDRFQFQNDVRVPSVGDTIYRIGRTYQSGVFFLTVPAGVTHLIVSTPVSNSTAVAYTAYQKAETTSDIFSDNQIIHFYDAGYYMELDGSIVQSSSGEWCMSCFIPVLPQTTYNLSSFIRYDKTCGNIYLIYHTASKKFMSSVNLRNVDTFATPADCRYIVLSGSKYECKFLYMSDASYVPKVFKRYGQDTTFNMQSLYNRSHWGNTVNWAKMGVNYLGSYGRYPKYPHGSKYAFLSAIYEGFDAILIDIIATSDGHYVVSHNDDLYPLAKNPDGTDLSNPYKIREHTFAEVRSVDMGYGYGERYHGTQILTFEEALSFVKSLGVKLVVEKVYTTTPEDFREMVKTIAKYGFREDVIIFSYYASELATAASIIPEAGLLFYVSGTEAEIDAKITSAIALKNGKNEVIINQFATNQNTLTSAQIQTLIDNGLYYSVSTPSSEPDGLLEFMASYPLTSYVTHFGTTIIPANKIILDNAISGM